MADLERQFDFAMLDIYKRARAEINYTPSVFYRMLTEMGGIATAKQLINAPQPSDGYTRLYTEGRLDLTVEAVVVENSKWHALFTEDELGRARKRLKDYRYEFKTPPE